MGLLRASLIQIHFFLSFLDSSLLLLSHIPTGWLLFSPSVSLRSQEPALPLRQTHPSQEIGKIMVLRPGTSALALDF